ncbi:polysaccharide deacetylase family protein [Aureimonas phyllosphaerae]|uniref:Uncharacterized protein n=1 Tax=Aureimonas phyllosphaerae TaxID=1166078 RepID=A0A7W6FWB8_9HYPH|nr:polysaccharide deacetylase family protein [Aureimonas phyllosphaerae]MBB3937725.1 hypothetical protein [Aureimonas phyllosphaerae]MBB3961740.1 hypothetical protein [Aureimonas phyllosphaerae]
MLGPLTASLTAGATSGTLVAAIIGLGSGETIASGMPNDGRLALDVTRRNLLVGASAVAAGTFAATLTTSAGRTLGMRPTVNASDQPDPASILIESFDSTTNWSAVAAGSGSQTIDTVGKDQGAGRAVFTPGTTGAPQVTKTTGYPNYDASKHKVFAYLVDKGNDPELSNGADLRLGQAANGVNYPAGANIGKYPDLNGALFGNMIPGKHVRFTSAADMATAGVNLVDGAPMGVRAFGGFTSPFAPKVDALIATDGGRPTVVLTFDDGRVGPWTKRQYLADRRIPVTLYIPWALVGQLNRLTLSQLQDMKALGHDIQLDGTCDDGAMIDRASAAAAVTELLEGKQWLADNGLNSDARHFCYPNGLHRSAGPRVALPNPVTDGSNVITVGSHSNSQSGQPIFGDNVPAGTWITVVISATQLQLNRAVPAGAAKLWRGNVSTLTDTSMTSGSPVLTVTSSADLMVGARAFSQGIGIPDYATIQSIENATQVTLSASATATKTGSVTFIETSHPFHTGKLPAALKAAGFLTGRTTIGNPIFSKHGIFDQGLVLPSYTLSQATLSTYQTVVGHAKRTGSTVFMYGHDLGGGLINQETADFRAGMDFLAAERDAGNIDILTVSQWWLRDCANPLAFPA